MYNFINLNVKADLLISEMGMWAYFYTKPSVLAGYLMLENRESESQKLTLRLPNPQCAAQNSRSIRTISETVRNFDLTLSQISLIICFSETEISNLNDKNHLFYGAREMVQLLRASPCWAAHNCP